MKLNARKIYSVKVKKYLHRLRKKEILTEKKSSIIIKAQKRKKQKSEMYAGRKVSGHEKAVPDNSATAADCTGSGCHPPL
jgi:hypothetical protein